MLSETVGNFISLKLQIEYCGRYARSNSLLVVITCNRAVTATSDTLPGTVCSNTQTKQDRPIFTRPLAYASTNNARPIFYEIGPGQEVSPEARLFGQAYVSLKHREISRMICAPKCLCQGCSVARVQMRLSLGSTCLPKNCRFEYQPRNVSCNSLVL
jgi:hypothetical protein